MAQGKNKIIWYKDWADIFEELTDEEAGKLIKHFCKYVNDENPKSDRTTELLFINIRNTLKRDLKKWEQKAQINAENGKKGGRPSKPKETQENPVGFSETQTNPEKGVSDSVRVSDSDIVSDSDRKKILMSNAKASDVSSKNEKFFNLALSYYNMFEANAKSLNVTWNNLKKITAEKFINPIRLMVEQDGITEEDLIAVGIFLQHDEFWMKNIQSTEKLRKQFDTLITQARNGKKGKTVESASKNLAKSELYKNL